MPYVITEPCLGEQYASCVAVCPVNCIHPGKYLGEAFMVIDPLVCIDCGLCLPECPVGAITDKIEKDPAYTDLNAKLSPHFAKNPPVTPRPVTEAPRKPIHKLVH